MALVVAQRVNDLSDDVGRYLEPLQRFTKPFGQDFFLEAREIALASVARAAVVDVLFFLHVTGKHAAVVVAVHQPAEGYLSLGVLWSVVTGEHRLHRFEDPGIDEELMRTAISFARPLEESNVEPILQDEMDVAQAHSLPEFGLEHLA